jgi:PII-like signaling protein
LESAAEVAAAFGEQVPVTEATAVMDGDEGVTSIAAAAMRRTGQGWTVFLAGRGLGKARTMSRWRIFTVSRRPVRSR